MKKCYNIKTWEEQKDVTISLDEKCINIPFAKDGFNITKIQEFSYNNGFAEVEISHSLDYNRVYSGNLQLIKGASVKSQSEQEFTKHQNKYSVFKEDFDTLYNDGKIDFTGEYRKSLVCFLQSTPTDPILSKLCDLTGAEMYGDYVMLNYFDKYKVGDIITQNTSYDIEEIPTGYYKRDAEHVEYSIKYLIGYGKIKYSVIGFSCRDYFADLLWCKNLNSHYQTAFTIDKNNIFENDFQREPSEKNRVVTEDIINIFEEYSKFLRGEENKWEEVKELLNL
jgi:hypothetical protein